MENSVEIAQKIKNKLTIWPSCSTPGYLSTEHENTNSNTCTLMSIAALFLIVCVYTYNGILLSHKKEWNPAICDNTDGPWSYYVKWSKSDREKQILYGFTHMWILKQQQKKKNKTKQKQTHRYKKQISGY